MICAHATWSLEIWNLETQNQSIIVFVVQKPADGVNCRFIKIWLCDLTEIMIRVIKRLRLDSRIPMLNCRHCCWLDLSHRFYFRGEILLLGDLGLDTKIPNICFKNQRIRKFRYQRNRVFATNSNFHISVSLQPNDLKFFKLWIINDLII